MNEEHQLRLARLVVGLVLAVGYLWTGTDGVIILMAAFLFGIPIEQATRIKKE